MEPSSLVEKLPSNTLSVSQHPTTLAVVCPPPSPSASLVHPLNDMDDAHFALNPLSSTGSSQREDETNTRGKKQSRFTSQSLELANLEAIADRGSQQKTAKPFVSSAVTTFLTTMGWTLQDLQDHKISLRILDKILTVETNRTWNTLRWVNLDHWLTRAFHYPLLDLEG